MPSGSGRGCSKSARVTLGRASAAHVSLSGGEAARATPEPMRRLGGALATPERQTIGGRAATGAASERSPGHLLLARLLLAASDWPPTTHWPPYHCTTGLLMLAVSDWPPSTGLLILAAYCWPPTRGRLRLTAHCWGIPTAGRLLPAAYCWPPTALLRLATCFQPPSRHIRAEPELWRASPTIPKYTARCIADRQLKPSVDGQQRTLQCLKRPGWTLASRAGGPRRPRCQRQPLQWPYGLRRPDGLRGPRGLRRPHGMRLRRPPGLGDDVTNKGLIACGDSMASGDPWACGGSVVERGRFGLWRLCHLWQPDDLLLPPLRRPPGTTRTIAHHDLMRPSASGCSGVPACPGAPAPRRVCT